VPIKTALIKVMFIFHKFFASDNKLGYFVFFQPRQPWTTLHICHTHMTNHTHPYKVHIEQDKLAPRFVSSFMWWDDNVHDSMNSNTNIQTFSPSCCNSLTSYSRLNSFKFWPTWLKVSQFNFSQSLIKKVKILPSGKSWPFHP